MKIPVLVTALIAAVAFAAPAEAKSRKSAKNPKPATAAVNGSYDVIDFDGRLAGRDPDPNIRLMIRKDPRPWEGTD